MRTEINATTGERSEFPDAEVAPLGPDENPRIAEIKAELVALDFKRIRPLAEGDTEYLATINAQAVALRAELTALTAA